ncbi:MAG: DUF488 domain-containing protein [Methylococcaceae bacterium]|nr:DUF488 domain-containing protein [Methylococcaceae bacterium]
MKTFTIGFTQKTAEKFFSLIKKNNIIRVVDVRLNVTSQLAGFAKKNDLAYFLKELCKVDYIHLLDLAPTKPMLDAYKNKAITWESYSDKFINLMAQRNIERTIDKSLIDNGCLLCSEHQPHQCHRRLVVEYLNKQWDENIKIVHLS